MFFPKASAAAVLAASAAGVLTGCDGGGSEIPSATIGLGEFEVTMTGNMTITGDEVVGNENANGYLCKPNVRIPRDNIQSSVSSLCCWRQLSPSWHFQPSPVRPMEKRKSPLN